MANIDQLPQRNKDLAAACAHGKAASSRGTRAW
jgi:hypothetical protein